MYFLHYLHLHVHFLLDEDPKYWTPSNSMNNRSMRISSQIHIHYTVKDIHIIYSNNLLLTTVVLPPSVFKLTAVLSRI